MPKKETNNISRAVRLMHEHMSDPEIAAGLVNGDRKAATALFDKYNNKVNQLVRCLLGTDSEHNDVVHTVFVHILTSVKNLKNPECFPGWVTGIAINTVHKEIRNRKRRRILHLVAEYPETGLANSSYGMQYPVKRVFGAINDMKADDHAVFVLRFIERNTCDEIAASYGYSVAKVRRRIHKAKHEFVKRVRKDAILSGLIEGCGTGRMSGPAYLLEQR